MRTRALRLAALAVILAPLSARAGCPREDVEFYLEKGFTTEQIVKICSDEAPAKPVPRSRPERPAPRGADEKALLVGIKAYDVAVGSAAVAYTLKDCVEYGDEDIYGFTRKACVRRRYTIRLDGLKVSKPRRRLLIFRAGRIRVRGSIDRTILGGLEGLDRSAVRLVTEKLETGDETVIPVRDDSSPKRVAAVLKKLAR